MQSTYPLATWTTRLRWLQAVGVAVGGVILTAVGSAIGIAAHLDRAVATWLLAGFVGASALIGLGIMRASGHSVASYGFRRPVHLPAVWYALPLAVLPLITLVATGITVLPATALAFLALTIAVGFNEEIWFRGLLLAALRRLGERRAVLIAGVMFGVLHLANAASGATPLYLVLQLGLATAVGVVLAEVVAITRSLWIGIAWHIAFDLCAFLGGDALSANALIGLAVQCVVLVGYAVLLWRRLPDEAAQSVPLAD